jgi:hypothetical protein
MNRPHLRPCPGCSRHVRVSEVACPFCGVSLDASFAAAPAPIPPSVRLSRAALFAYGTGALVLGSAASATVVIDCNYTDAHAYGGIFVPEDASEPVQDSALGTADVQVGSVDANGGDSSAGDAGSDAPDATSTGDAD